MTNTDYSAVQTAYFRSVNAYADASAVVYQHALNRTNPTATEIQRKEDTHALLEAARAAYFEARAELGGPNVVMRVRGQVRVHDRAQDRAMAEVDL